MHCGVRPPERCSASAAAASARERHAVHLLAHTLAPPPPPPPPPPQSQAHERLMHAQAKDGRAGRGPVHTSAAQPCGTAQCTATSGACCTQSPTARRALESKPVSPPTKLLRAATLLHHDTHHQQAGMTIIACARQTDGCGGCARRRRHTGCKPADAWVMTTGGAAQHNTVPQNLALQAGCTHAARARSPAAAPRHAQQPCGRIRWVSAPRHGECWTGGCDRTLRLISAACGNTGTPGACSLAEFDKGQR
jgi:hypothetical protein